jgi:hypothetical protein
MQFASSTCFGKVDEFITAALWLAQSSRIRLRCVTLAPAKTSIQALLTRCGILLEERRCRLIGVLGRA